MKTTRPITKSLIVSLLLTASVLAADLRNEDGVRYEVKVHEGATTTNTWIDGNNTIGNICSECEIEVVGVGKIKVKGSERVVIKDGKLSKQ
jgi:hypothetical protein